MDSDGSVTAQTRSGDGCNGCDGLSTTSGEMSVAHDVVNQTSTQHDLATELESLRANPLPMAETIAQNPLQEINHSSSNLNHPSQDLKDSSALNELIGRRIRSVVTGKVGVVKELKQGGHIPVMVIVQFDGDEFTIPTSPEKLTFEDGSPFPKLESASTVSEKETESPEPDWSSYPHLTSSDNRVYQKRAGAIVLEMLSASNINELKALSQKYTRTEMIWVYRNLLNVPQREQIVAVAAAQQLSLLEE